MAEKKNTTSHSIAVLNAFHGLCSRLYSDWSFHRSVFSDNPRKLAMEKSIAGRAFERFSIISSESILLQIAKLHDPAIQQGHVMLGLEYMVRFGGWDKFNEEKLSKLKKKLDELANKVRPARHKILSHNDLEVILSGATLGRFPNGEDEKYFETLKEFTDVIFSNVIGENWQFSDDSAEISQGLLWFFREDACSNQTKNI